MAARIRLARPRKYRNVPTVVGGVRFDSKKEAARYLTLSGMLKRGQIREFWVHPSFPLEVNGVLVCTYKADFSYVEVASGEKVVEDVKGVLTREYKIKKKLLQALTGIVVLET